VPSGTAHAARRCFYGFRMKAHNWQQFVEHRMRGRGVSIENLNGLEKNTEAVGRSYGVRKTPLGPQGKGREIRERGGYRRQRWVSIAIASVAIASVSVTRERGGPGNTWPGSELQSCETLRTAQNLCTRGGRQRIERRLCCCPALREGPIWPATHPDHSPARPTTKRTASERRSGHPPERSRTAIRTAGSATAAGPVPPSGISSRCRPGPGSRTAGGRAPPHPLRTRAHGPESGSRREPR